MLVRKTPGNTIHHLHQDSSCSPGWAGKSRYDLGIVQFPEVSRSIPSYSNGKARKGCVRFSKFWRATDGTHMGKGHPACEEPKHRRKIVSLPQSDKGNNEN